MGKQWKSHIIGWYTAIKSKWSIVYEHKKNHKIKCWSHRAGCGGRPIIPLFGKTETREWQVWGQSELYNDTLYKT